MKYLFLGTDADLNRQLGSMEQIMPEELVLLEPSWAVTEKGLYEAIQTTCAKSSHVVLIADDSSITSPEWYRPYWQAGLRSFCIRFRMTAADNLAPRWETARFAPIFERTAIAKRFQAARQMLPAEATVAAIFEPDRDALDVLGPSIFHLSQQGLPWVIVDPRQLSIREDAKSMQAVLEWLRIKGFRTRLYYHPLQQPLAWNAQTKNIFCGPRAADIDVANTCTHNCRFCGLYGPDAVAEMKRRGGGRLPPEIQKMMSTRINPKICLDFISDLPDTLHLVQFGGIGDPFTHPEIMSFIRKARHRGFRVEALTNYAYLTDEMIEELHSLGGRSIQIHFIVNFSAATPETYVKVRPNQTRETFLKVARAIRRTTELKARDGGFGVDITLMSVVNRYNYHEMPDFVSMGKELEVESVWLKPMEVHGDVHLPTLPTKDQHDDYRIKARKSLELADRLGVRLFARSSLEAMAAK